MPMVSVREACEDAARADALTTFDRMATLPGVLLYERYGFIVLDRRNVTMPDGVTLACVSMRKPVEQLGEEEDA